MSKTLKTACHRHEITVEGGAIRVETFMPDSRGAPSIRRGPWTRDAVSLPEHMTEDEVELVFAKAGRHGIDVVVDVQVPGQPRAWLWRVSPARIRTATAITYMNKHGRPRQIRSRFSVRGQGSRVGSGRKSDDAIILVEDMSGTAVLNLNLSPTASALATLLTLDRQFDLFVSYKAQDINDTPCQQMVEEARKEGLTVWFAPDRLQGRGSFIEPINEAIRRSMGYLIVWSDHSREHSLELRDVEEGREETEEHSSRRPRSLLPSHIDGVQKMNQLYEVRAILQHVQGDLDKLQRVWVFDARSVDKRSTSGFADLKGALSETLVDEGVLDNLHVDPSVEPSVLIDRISDVITAGLA